MSEDITNRGEVLDVTAEEGGAERLHMPPGKRALLIVCVTACVLVIAASVTAFILVRNACLRPVKSFFAAVQNADGAAFAETLPKCVLDSFGSESAAAYYEENMLKESLAELEEDYGDRIRISFEEEQRFALDKPQISAVEQRLREKYGGIDIEKAYDLTVSYTVRGSLRSETRTREFTVCKADGRWVMAGVPNTII